MRITWLQVHSHDQQDPRAQVPHAGQSIQLQQARAGGALMPPLPGLPTSMQGYTALAWHSAPFQLSALSSKVQARTPHAALSLGTCGFTLQRR